MAGEFKHQDAGEVLTRTEDNATNRHYMDGQQVGDIIKARSITVLERLAIGNTGEFLEVVAGTPAWVAHKAVTTGVHGVGAGAIVGTTLSQELTNKTLTEPNLQLENLASDPTAALGRVYFKTGDTHPYVCTSV